MSILANRLSVVKPSKTLEIAAKAASLRASGEDVISLSTGEPDFDTPINIKNAAIWAINDGKTKYTPASGTPELKKAIISKFKRDNNLDYTTDEIIAGNGGKQVIYNLLMATINEGDEVIIPAPYWVSYPDMVLLCGGKPVILAADASSNFAVDVAKLETLITPKTKWLFLNSPNNPSGVIYSDANLAEIAKIIQKHQHVNVLTDDIYEHILHEDNKFSNILNIAPELKSRVFIVNGVSKAYSMTGWRIGYGAGPKDIIKAMNLLQSQSTSNPCSISQAAATEALTGSQDFIKKNAETFSRRKNIALEMLEKITGINCRNAQGAFYLFPNISGLFGKKTPSGEVINSSASFAKYIIEDAKVAIVPGSAFGCDEHFRMSVAVSPETIKEAISRISSAVAQLK